MKKFNEIRRIDEAPTYGLNPSVGTPGAEGNYDTVDVTLHDPSNLKTIERLNAYLLSANRTAYIDADWVIRQIKNKLVLFGYDFNVNSAPMDLPFDKPVTMEYPIRFMGGRYGVLDQNYTIGFDDNITHKLGYGSVSYTHLRAHETN